jgi:DNA polymerase-3 subunit delta
MKNNIYLLYGTEDFLIDEEIRAIRRRTIGEATALNYNCFSRGQLDINTLINALQTVDLFSPQKMLVIEAEPLFKKTGLSDQSEAGEDAQAVRERPSDTVEQLITALQECPETVTVVFKTGEVDLRKKLGKWLKANSQLREFQAYKPWEEAKVEEWVRERFRGQGFNIAPEALGLFVDTAGRDLRLLDQEVRKVAVYIYKGKDRQITVQDIRAVTSGGELDALELVEDLRRRDIKSSLLVLKALQKEEEPVVLLGLLVAQFRLFLQIRQALEAGMSMEELGTKLGKHPFYLKKLAGDINRYSLPELKELYFLLQKTDMALKTGAVDPWLGLEEFVLAVG